MVMLNASEKLILDGTYTVSSAKGHRTFEISTVSKGKKLEGKRIVSLLSGSDNTSDYTGFAFLSSNGIHVWNKFKTQPNAKEKSLYDVYAALLWSLISEGENSRFAANYTLMVEGVCFRCGRKLTTPQSLELGLGSECAKKAGY